MPCKLANAMTQDKREKVTYGGSVPFVEVIRKLWRALMLNIKTVSTYGIFDAVASDDFAAFNRFAVVFDSLSNAACYQPVALFNHSSNTSSSSACGALNRALDDGVKPSSASRFRHRSANL